MKGLPAAIKEEDEEETGDKREDAWKVPVTAAAAVSAVQLLLVVVVVVVQIKGLQISCNSSNDVAAASKGFGNRNTTPVDEEEAEVVVEGEKLQGSCGGAGGGGSRSSGALKAADVTAAVEVLQLRTTASRSQSGGASMLEI